MFFQGLKTCPGHVMDTRLDIRLVALVLRGGKYNNLIGLIECEAIFMLYTLQASCTRVIKLRSFYTFFSHRTRVILRTHSSEQVLADRLYASISCEFRKKLKHANTGGSLCSQISVQWQSECASHPRHSEGIHTQPSTGVYNMICDVSNSYPLHIYCPQGATMVNTDKNVSSILYCCGSFRWQYLVSIFCNHIWKPRQRMESTEKKYKICLCFIFWAHFGFQILMEKYCANPAV